MDCNRLNIMLCNRLNFIWLHKCTTLNLTGYHPRVDEEVFPHSYNPKMTLNMTQTSTTRARSGRKKSTAVADKKAADDKAVAVDETLKESIKGDHSRCSQPPVDIKKKSSVIL